MTLKHYVELIFISVILLLLLFPPEAGVRAESVPKTPPPYTGAV